jgi:hypothetical protein
VKDAQSLTLPLFVSGIIANHPNNAAAPYDLALFADTFHAGANLHGRALSRF